MQRMSCCFVLSRLQIISIFVSIFLGYLAFQRIPVSRATTPVEDIETFDPFRPSLSLGDSTLLWIDKIPSYSDKTLNALTLHIEARTTF